MFVAGGYGNVLMYSPDAANWTNADNSIGSTIVYGLTFGNGRFVGVGKGYALYTAFLETSTDGINWQQPSRPTTNTLRGVTFGNGMYVAVGELGTIITSPDGANWTVRNSGTARNLRAVTYTGTRFLAGGEAATILTSMDGISWSPSAPPSFDVTGLASGGGAVVAVGAYNGSNGRLHASSDGLGWPGHATTVAQPLNGVAYVNGRFMALGDNGLILQSDVSLRDAYNIWTKPTSGNWEEPYWSLGELPSTNQAGVMFTNSGYKALAISYATTINHPESMQMKSLEVDAPEDSSNLLLLNYAGLSVPLQISQVLNVGTRGSLLSYSSALKASTAYVRGSATFADNSEARFSYLDIGYIPAGELTLSNGLLSVGYLTVGSKFNQYGGSNLVGSLTLWGEGVYNSTNGIIIVTNRAGIGGDHREAKLTISGGSLKLRGGLLLGLSADNSGTLLIADGNSDIDTITADEGNYIQSGGLSFVGAMFPAGDGIGRATLSGGTLTTSNLTLGWENDAMGVPGSFTQSGGSHVNTGRVDITGRIRHGAKLKLGEYSLSGGRLDTPLLNIATGDFTQTGGASVIGLLEVSSSGLYFLRDGVMQMTNAELEGSNSGIGPAAVSQQGGSNLISSSLTVRRGGAYGLTGGFLSVSNMVLDGGQSGQSGGTNRVKQLSVQLSGAFTLSGGILATTNSSLNSMNVGTRAGLSSFFQTGGSHLIQNRLSIDGIYHLQGGILNASEIGIDVDGMLSLEGGTVANRPPVTMDLGAIAVQGQNNVGKLRVLISGALSRFSDGPAYSVLDLQSGNSIIRFLDSHDVDWTGRLSITNWTGAMPGGGTDQIFFGTSSQGLTASQLQRITFANPAGFAAGNYPAQILATGEVVPDDRRPSLNYSRASNGLQFSWNNNSYQLLSSTNVAGPYLPMSPEPSSPYSVSFSGPQRFFVLRNR